MPKSQTKRYSAAIAAAALCLLLAGCSLPSGKTDAAPAAQAGQDPGNMTVHFIDVGQGDSTLIESRGKFLLIDGGNNDQEQVVTSYLKNQGVNSLDYVILTHPDADHAGGIDAVLEAFDVGKLIMPPVSHTTKTFEDVLDAAASKNLKLTKPVVGTEYQLGNAAFTIIAPNGDYGDDLNNWSVGVKVTNGRNSFVLCGDAEKDAEHDIATNGLDITADVLKLGHHGSSTSSSDEFLDRVNPSFAVISCGKDNSYGHPHKETLEKMRERGITVYRTDALGTIKAVSDGKKITWNGKEGKISQSDLPSSSSSSSQESCSESYRAEVEQDYVLNTSTKKFHLPSCSSASQMKETNKKDYHGLRQDLIGEGYSPCKSCKP